MDHQPASDYPLVWIDLEMTGLAIEKDTIIEIATILTYGKLEKTVVGPTYVINAPDELLDGMTEVVAEMHAESGLTEAARRSQVTMEEAEQGTLAFLREHIDKPEVAILAGNTVHTDRAYMTKYMPELAAFLHYRHVDVTTLKEVIRRWAPQLLRGRPEKASGHRAQADIEESIAELRFYVEVLGLDADVAPLGEDE